MKKWLLTFACVLLAATVAQAAPIIIDLGTAAPPAVIGGYTMTAFPLDGRPLFDVVSGVASPCGGTVGFSAVADHRQIGRGGPRGVTATRGTSTTLWVRRRSR